MGQHLSNINLQIVNLLESSYSIPSPTAIVSSIGSEDISLFLSSEISSNTINDKYQISKQWTRQIQNYLYHLIHIPEFEIINIQMDNIYTSIITDYQQIIQEINNNFENQEQLRISFLNKIIDDNDNKQQSSSVSKRSIIQKLTERHVSTRPHHSSRSIIIDLSLSNKRVTEQLETILKKFLTSNISFKDILFVLNQFLFDKNNIYDLRNIFIQFNDRFLSHRREWENEQMINNNNNNKIVKQTIDAKLFAHLTSIGAFPNARLKNMLIKQFTGQFISFFILIHIDFHNTINMNKQFNSGSIHNSMSFEFHPDTYKQLFDIIKQLSIIPTKDLNINLIYILIICLRLFSTHLKFLFTITINSFNDLLLTTDNQIKIDRINQEINLNDLTISNDDLQIWFDTLLILACRNNENSEQIIISSQASKCFIQILNKKISSFTEKLSFIHQYIIENKSYILIEELLIEFNTNTTLLNWIEILCNNIVENTNAFNILYLFLDIYFNPSNDMKPKIKEQIQQIIQRFQQFIFMQLSSTYSLANIYISYILNNFNSKLEIINDLLNPILIGLGLMTETYFNFTTIQSIITYVLPLLAEFILKNSIDENIIANNLHYIYWLLGKMSYILIVGRQNDVLEIKYMEKLQSSLFAGGCEKLTIESNQYLYNLFESNIVNYIQFKKIDYNFEQSSTDQEFLMSIYHNINQGAQLISKIKMFIKDKQYLLQKSIEQQANYACSALFAVYIKFFRRINLAKYELTRIDNKKPHKKLLSIFEYATHVYILFAKTKGQGGNCDELYNQIKMNTLFLLTSIKESNLISIIEYETNEEEEEVNKIKLKHQYSQKIVNKYNFRLLRNMFQICIRFKKLMLAKKKINEEKEKNENILRRTIDNFIFNEKNFQSNEFIQCISQQYERAMIRLIIYQFIYKFIQKIFNFKDKNQIILFLRIYLPYLRAKNIDWSYLENISATNVQLKENITKNYYLIVKQIFSYLLQSTTIDQVILVQNVFYLLNLSYELTDIYYLYNNEFLEILNNTFLNSNLDIKFIIYNWFRLYVLKFCEKFQLESNSLLNEIQEFIFNKIILMKLKLFKELFPIKIENKILDEKNSFTNVTIEWFIKAKDTSNVSTKFEIDLYINQYLMILLRCIHVYEHIQSYCATDKYIEELIYLYQNSENQITCLLSLKILRKLIIFLSEDFNQQSKLMMKNFLTNILFSINKTTTDITTELIYLYRTIISSNKSSLQTMAIQLILDTITSNLKSFQSIDNVLSSLCILGGYIQPLCLGSIVEIHDNDGIQLGVIIDINKNVLDLNTTDVLPYLVQFIQTNEIKWIREDKLRIQKDVLPPNLLELTDTNEFIDLLFDALAYFIQIDKSTIDSLLLLQLKRRSILVLYRILNHKKLVDIFIQKPYVSIIAQLSISALLLKTYQQSTNLHLLNKHQLEQYCLNLDRCKYFKQIINNNMNNTLNDEFIIWTKIPFKTDLLIDDLLSTNEWKSSMSKRNIELFKKGRLGNDEIKIIELSSQLTGKWFLEECGITHRFPGRIYLVSENSNKLTATFIIENLQLTEGNWYFCIRLLESTSIRIGWATNGFKSNDSIGIGYDQYSWSYDGSQGMIYNNEQYPFEFEYIRWNTNDVCGCGIEINDNHIRINYWLNGYFLGTAFTHQLPINSTTTTICNMLPNGNRTSYFPGVSLNVNETSILSSCEFIFHPMDMFECPLPNGYKPLVIPTLLDINDLFVPYPFSAYLIGNNIEDYIIHKRNNRSIKFLRDFINNYHLENIFILDNHQLILTEQSQGFPLTIDYEESLTISFNFSILKISNDYLDIILLTFDTQDKYSIQIPINKITNNTQIAIIFQINERKIKVYINNECRIFECPIITKFNIHILPTLNVGIQNLAIWKYSLTEEHIQRLFTSGLSYIAIDYYRLNQYRKQVNMFTFTINQQYFENDLLIPFNELFDEIKWKKKKIEIDEDESKYFNINNGNIQLFGNKTYLVLDKSIDPWFEYTLIFDISINYLPIILVRLNEHSNICIAHDGQLCLLINNEKIIQSQSKLPLNEYIRLLISVHDKSIKIYINGLLKLDTNLDNNQLAITDKRIDLFKELDLTTNIINEDILRVECKSIIYLNKPINDIDEKMTSSNYSLESLIAFPYSIISPSLIHIGYDELSIKLAMKQTITRNIQLIDTILREKNFNKYNENILSKLGFSINKEKLKDLIEFFSQYDTEEKIINLGEILLNLENNIQTLSIDKNWFHQTIDHLNIDNNFTEWIQDKSNINEQIDLTYQLIDLNQSIQEKSILTNNNQLNNIEYPYKDMTQLKYYESRISCEYQLISIYAHYTILNILKIWSYDGSSLFPLEKFGDCIFIVKLLRLLDYHYRYTRLHTDEPIDRMSLLINSIIKIELNELIKYYKIEHNNITYDILRSKAPLLYHLQKDIMSQSIKILIDPSLLILEYNDEYNIEKPNFKFILKLIQLFIKLISEKSIIKQEYIDLLMPVLFPESLINMLFNLFILNPLHENKCIILRLFSTLIQISHNFNLNKNIQNFLFHLFIELPPNSTSINTQTMRTFQIVIMDLIYLLIEKQKYQLISSTDITNELFKLPKSFHDLLMMIDIIKALTDKTKHTTFPEIFIIQSIILLGENLQLTRDDIEKSNNYFNTISDLQLIHFMNNNELLKISFIEFINSLPNESIPNSLYYKSYPSLWHIPAIYIQIRAKIIYEFNIIFEKLISFIDLSLLPEQSILTNKIQQVKSYILYETKSKFFDTTVTITSLENINDIPTVNFEIVETNSNKSTMFNQAFEQLYNNAYITFRNEYNQLWRAQYLAMHSTDQGGPYRDSITRICSDICSTRLSLFILCPNGRTNSGLNDDCWIPNIYPPNEFIPNRIKKQYQFIGQLMGMAIRKKHYLDLKFPNLLWKQLVREQITIEDIENIDIQCFTMINQMEKSIKENNSSIDMNEFLSSILDELRFEVLSSNGQTYELVPNGKNIPITISNFKDYCSSYREYHLNEFFRQIECIRQGLYSIVPGYFLGLFTASELEEIVCGKGEIDVELLKRNTMYGGHYNKDSLTIQRFWTILREIFNVEQKKLFLKFVWGRCTLPNCDDDFGTKFRIEPYILSNELIDGALPRAHTCTFVLDLPEYSTIDIMYDRLNYAITYCISIDGDGNMDEAPILTDFESDSATEE